MDQLSHDGTAGKRSACLPPIESYGNRCQRLEIAQSYYQINLANAQEADAMMDVEASSSEGSARCWLCHADDTVAIALEPLARGQGVSIAGRRTVLLDDIPKGHKFALIDHRRGEPVLRYGEQIGLTTQAVRTGAHVHSHNLATALLGERHYGEVHLTEAESRASPLTSWRGYRRADGRYATRNEIWLLPTVGCVAPLVEMVAREAQLKHAGKIDAIVGFGHPHGCSQLGDDLAGTRAALAALCDNPNAGGVVLVGLGCESNQLDDLVAMVPERSRSKLRIMRAQEPGDEMERALALVDELVGELALLERETAPASALVVGLKCGGSDAFSGLTANPLLGRFSDRVAASDGRLILTEIPEIFGAEDALLGRATSPEVFDAAGKLLNRFKRYFLDHGQPVSENPSPGNIAGGITTLEEKSLGAVQKAGKAPLMDVIDYGGIAHKPGVTLLEAPGNDAVSSTALAAAGATMILFTTGRGTPLGFPVPTVKVASNSALAQAKAGWIDFDAGRTLSEGADTVSDAFADYLLAVASGESTSAERNGQRVISLWKRGVTL
ncbi:UxaA family hydrolase [Parerythrobacter lacustris]|uniref:Altronate dehydratase family protein n=1 Tax=Parerythrobacter lacustris TaxID=2969984 RepID=A0ABT1XNE8_9SPHN|nr:altronate dehydratase family protein [Parerythrobacter lacustris]MCR2833168.1 altronate dehydratase family protein [Parerythrobacter lacustris]